MENRIDLQRPDAPDMAGYGAHAVGWRDWVVETPPRPDLRASGDGPVRMAPRVLRCAVWYPARAGGDAARYRTTLRDGRQEAWLQGRAVAGADAEEGQFPLVILSHGWPGNRFLMAHLGETLASRGHVVVAADHPGSTYEDRLAGVADFGITLLHRAWDQAFLTRAAEAAFPQMIEPGRAAIVGYSMGGYGALISAGAGLSDTGTGWPGGARGDLMARHAEGTAEALPGLRAIVAIGPWGAQHGFWSDRALAAIRVPMLVIGGDGDDISGYTGGIRRVFEAAAGCDRWLLTFQGAGHNAAAPIPAPHEAWARVPWLDFPPFEHYADPVWDSLRMNNVAQHMIAAFLDQALRGADQAARLAPFDGGHPAGFGATGAPGLRLEWRRAGQP
ncbi:alpha/beta hydrolase family protein [Paragemmobacter ruber]|uniref:Alpha/beta fold hydrolase n=1 Tax=Paragemmobacter ruber TaxID=1985673 RepID=A0ABW9Y790_9RHOB|nr:alpha/beta fold hydrolase [Rhodobacter ruber]NBE08447.1 alpha/beta fold hydrolase [Rhodobacter ruber]